MNRKVLSRRNKNSKAVSPKISLECLENHTGLKAKDMIFVIAERPEEGEFAIFPAVVVPGTDTYVNLMTGEIVRCSVYHTLSMAQVRPVDDYFIFSAPSIARNVFLPQQQLRKVFGQGVIN